VLLVALVVPGLDLLALLQTHAIVPGLSLAGCGLAGVLLGLTWLRQPRETWLGSAALAVAASAALRLIGAPEAPLLSLMAVVALGIGGAFAAPGLDLDATLGDA
jgi:hypothetical protein